MTEPAHRARCLPEAFEPTTSGSVYCARHGYRLVDVGDRRDRYYAASQRKFVPYATPLIFKRGAGQYPWDETGRRYIDLLAMNVCVSGGHAHPRVVAAVGEQAAARVFEETRNQGLIVSQSGPHRSVLRMVPPPCLSMDDVEPTVKGLARSLEKA